MATRSNDRNWFSSMYLLVLIPCAVIRFALFAPLGYYWTHSNNHWDLIKGHTELLDGGFNSSIATGEKLAARWGTFAFYWNFAVWVPSFWFPPPLNLPFTVIDSVSTGYMSLATHYQTGYVPHSKASCKGAAYSWHRPSGANESFFETAGRLNATVATPVDMCKSFVEEWQYGVAISFFYALISLANIIAFFGAVSDARKQGETALQLLEAVATGIFKTVINVFKGLGLLLALIFWWIPELFFRCLPQRVSTNARFGRRYVLKSWLGFGQTTELGVTELNDVYKYKKRDKYPRVQCGNGKQSPLSSFLGIYDMLMVVTEELHYLDVMNLSRVSKSVRDVVLPTNDFNRRIDTFKRYTCKGEQKEDCWVCDKQICATCRCTPEICEATLSHHLHNCRPYCTKCHKNHIVKRPRNYRAARTKSPYCKCAPATRNPNFAQRWFNGANYYSSKQWNIPKVKRHVCRECNYHSKTEILDMREEKTKMELKRGMRDGKKWTKCDKCKKDLETGPRWWICGISNCGLECRSTVHKGWGRKEKDGRSTPLGNEAV